MLLPVASPRFAGAQATMLFGPIVTLEMLTSARRLRYFIIRVLYALLLLGLLWMNYMSVYQRHRYMQQGPIPDRLSIQEVAQFSEQVFSWFSAVQLVAVVLLVPAMFAGAIAQERERRTIEYMFASMLTNSEIILSKFLSRTVQVASLLLVGLPVLAIAMMLGGIDPEQLMIVFAITAATLLSTAALSIAVSVWTRRSRDAVLRTYVLLLAALLLPPMMWGMLSAFSAVGGFSPVLMFLNRCCEYASWLNPFVALTLVHSASFGGGATFSPWGAVAPLLIFHCSFALVALGWSVLFVRRVYRKSAGAADRQRRRRFAFPLWRPQIGEHPMLWKELFAPSETVRLGWVGRIAVALLLCGSIIPGIVAVAHSGMNPGNYLADELTAMAVVISVVLECAALVVLTVRAAGAITSEKERDTWISLISTSLEPHEIVLGKMAGSIYSARWFLAPIAVWVVMVALVAPHRLPFGFFMVPSFFVIAVALSAIGIWFSSWCRTSIRAMASVVAAGIFFGGGYLMCCIPFTFMGGDEAIVILSPCIPFLLAAPGVLSAALMETHRTPRYEEFVVMFTLIVGTAGYLGLGALVAAANIRSFDRRAGRPSQPWGITGLGLNSAPAAPLRPVDGGAASAPLLDAADPPTTTDNE